MTASLPRGVPNGSDVNFRVHGRTAALFSGTIRSFRVHGRTAAPFTRTIRSYAHRPSSLDPNIQVPVI